MKLNKIKNLLCITLTFILIFIGMKGVLAYPSNYIVGSMPSSISASSTSLQLFYQYEDVDWCQGYGVHTGTCNSSVPRPHFMYKQTNGGVPLTCVKMVNDPPWKDSCSPMNIDETTQIKLARLLLKYDMSNVAGGGTGKDYTNYFIVEIVGQKMMYGNAVGCHVSIPGPYVQASSQLCDIINPIINDLNSYAGTAKNIKISTTDVSWTYVPSGDYFISSTISASTTDNTTEGKNIELSVSGPSGVRLQSNQIIIPSSSITGGEMNITVTAKKYYYKTTTYDCGSDVQQVLTPYITKNSVSDSLNLKVNLTGKVKVAKVNSKGNKIGGAKLKIKYGSETKEITTEDGKEYELSTQIPAGTKVCVTEVEAPQGYKKDTEEHCDNIKAGQTISINVTNNKTEVSISKQDIANSKEIKGATLEILDKDKKPIDRTKGKNTCIESSLGFSNDKYIEWKSGTQKNVIKCLPDGEYYLHEILPADGYTATEKQGTYLKFTMEDGKPKSEVVMKNELTTVLISKLDASSKKEIKGATLSILDEKKKQIDLTEEKYANVKIIDGEFIKDKGVSWVSTGETMEIQGLPIGTYYLVEDMAPAGYVKEKEMAPFEITMDGVIAKAKINNTLKVNVPDTGMNAWGYVIIGGLLLIVGMVVVYFVTRKKA